MNSAQSFHNKVILVTGASSGIGFASAQAFLAQGARRVYMTGRDASKLATAVATLGENAIGVVADVADLAQIEYLKTAITERGDTLDIIFANAGVAHHNIMGTSSEADFNTIFDINVKGVFFTVQTLLPLLNHGGNIVLNASVASSKGLPNLSLYSASKAAVRSFARSWANDLKGQQIRVNAISPGVTRTPIMENGLQMNEEQIAQFAAYLVDAAPAGRMAQTDEIAAAVLFLASSAASYINGIELSVDGGFTQI
ncbi:MULTISPECIES: SDR family NAD(P)-dependent oxidoreductase [Deefgea]|uniref:SDR family oxidoreductase n=1 Tax=Deefgea chitinilytica TaxID=570276 RepID=A0ABS2CAF6_9NEIS|nr:MULTISPECIES: SDR family oxidoreductase [Deefgea]MBM5571129.1 SDR family oxidoreductase [Deefgea chitinilytica]MBM9888359.1 SDR family oxidoreductase [Deefgea sp. CFH1-16]